MIRLTFFGFALAAVTGCQPATHDPGESAAAEAAIRSTSESWVSAYERGDAEMLANLFEEDAMYAANTGEVLRGRDGIREGARAWMARRPEGVELDLETQPVRYVFLGNSAHTVTRFVIRAMPAGCSIDSGHGLTVWRPQSNGSWLITTHLVNRDPQPAPDACPRQPALLPDAESLSTFRSHAGYASQPIVLLNLLDFDDAEAQGRYLREYAAPALRLIANHGGSLLWAGPIEQQLVGKVGGEWDYGAFVRWPSRAAFTSMVDSNEYGALHPVRQETLRSTLVLVASEPEAGQPPEQGK